MLISDPAYKHLFDYAANVSEHVKMIANFSKAFNTITLQFLHHNEAEVITSSRICHHLRSPNREEADGLARPGALRPPSH